MKRTSYIILILCGIFFQLHGQRANVFATYQLIENGKYEDAKKAIEEALTDDKTKDWPKTWHARGILCQKAYEDGIKNNDKKKYELYPDQLFVAYESFEKSLAYKRSARIIDQLEPIYVQLANDFMVLGEKEYKAKSYEKSLKAYENALKINESYIVSVELDSNLLYNTALAAYKFKQNEKSIAYLERLNAMSYSPNVSHLLYNIHLESGDTSNAEIVLKDGIDRYKKNEELVILFVDLIYKSKNCETAIAELDSVAIKYPKNYIYPFTKGLVFQKCEMYIQAIDAYKEAISLNPDKLDSYSNIGTCYFNIGVEKEQNALSINKNDLYREELAKSVSARNEAVSWLEKAFAIEPDNKTIKEQLLQLYRSLHMTDKIVELKP